MSDCSFSDKMQKNVVPTLEWIAAHEKHLEYVDDFGSESFDHPSGEWGFLICSCGARHLVTNLTEIMKEITE